MSDISLDVNYEELSVSTNALIGEISKISSKPFDLDSCESMWDVFGKLDAGDFSSLKSNFYFECWLRTIGVSVQRIERIQVSSGSVNNDSVLVDSVGNDWELGGVAGLPALITPLDEVDLPEKFLKLFGRLKNASPDHSIYKVGGTLGDVVGMAVGDISSFPGVGKSYEAVLGELKDLYHVQEATVEEMALDFSSVDIDNMRISYTTLSKNTIKALDKLDRHELFGGVKAFLELDLDALITVSGFGPGVINELASLKVALLQEVRDVSLGKVDVEQWGGDLLVPKYPKDMSVEKLGGILLEDIDSYFDKISEVELDVIQKRWGFVEEHKTLEEIGVAHKLTRQRVRHNESKVNEGLSKNIRLRKEVIWGVLEPALSADITQRLENFYSCFSSDKNFYEVLGLVSGHEGIEVYVNPPINPTILNDYFATNGGPVAYKDIKEYLVGCELDGVKDIDNAIAYLEQKQRIRIVGEKIFPVNLMKHEAAAYVLASKPNGLPWLDIARHVNSGDYSKTKLPIHRRDNSAVTCPENIFLSGNGVYKHTRYIDFELLSFDTIFDELLTYLDKTNRDVFQLNECYLSSGILKRQDYYVIRYIVKNYGEEYGFFFDGKSQLDSVGLEKGFVAINQKDVILEAMKVSDRPLTKSQVAARLKSNSLGHASIYLAEMSNSGQIVQVDRMLYTTPGRAYKDIEFQVYQNAIGNILTAQGKPVESSIFEKLLNEELSATYSKFFYASIARMSASQKGWYRKNSLYSMSPIPYESLNDALDTHCHTGQTTDKNIEMLMRYVAITREAAAGSLRGWRRDI